MFVNSLIILPVDEIGKLEIGFHNCGIWLRLPFLLVIVLVI